MKWKTKKTIYSINEFQEENFEGIVKLSLGLSGFICVGAYVGDLLNILESGKPLFDFKFIALLSIIPLGIMFIFPVVSLVLYSIAKHHSNRCLPILKKLEVINEFKNNTTNKYSSIDKLLYDEIEVAYFNNEEENQHLNLKGVLNQYDAEIEHIYTIAKNSKQFEGNMKKIAVKRANIIIDLLKASIKKDKEQREKIKQLEVEAIEKEWNETYISSKNKQDSM